MLTLLISILTSSVHAQVPQTAPESIIEPFQKDAVSSEFTIPTTYFFEHYSVSKMDDGTVVGFSFENNGKNRIIPKKAEIGMGPQRLFDFSMPERARQNLLIRITDVPTERLSEMMESYFMIFPRTVVPAIRIENNLKIVTLPTLEEVIFDLNSNEIIGGVLKEGMPIDLGPDRFKRKFADLTYQGSGVILRADKRGNDPRLGTQQFAIASYLGKNCKIPVTQLWDQSDKVDFKFPTDDGFFKFLKRACGFEVNVNLINSSPSP